MNTTTLRPLLVAGAVLCAAAAPAPEARDFNARDRTHEPPPSGHVPGKDNGAGRGDHNTGEDCGNCHTPGGKAGNLVFTAAGTVYEDRMARKSLRGAEIILEDIAGNVVSMTSNDVGNFWTTAPLASNPRAVASHGGITDKLYSYDANGALIPADPADSRTWQYKAWVRNGEDVRHMVTIAPVGGTGLTSARMSCNMHHAPTGGSGALWAGDRPTLGMAPLGEVSFKRHVQPIFVNRCAPCHIAGARATRLVTESDTLAAGSSVLDYSAGMDFTTYAGSSVTVTEGDVAKTYAKKGVRDVVDPADPANSRALVNTLRQPNGSVVHAGGSFWKPEDRDYQVILRWISEGAKSN